MFAQNTFSDLIMLTLDILPWILKLSSKKEQHDCSYDSVGIINVGWIKEVKLTEHMPKNLSEKKNTTFLLQMDC